jgi:hypothetical protein
VEALGICNIFDQVLDGLPEAEREAVFNAYVKALQQDPARYRADAAKLEAWAKGLSNPADIKPDASECCWEHIRVYRSVALWAFKMFGLVAMTAYWRAGRGLESQGRVGS